MNDTLGAWTGIAPHFMQVLTCFIKTNRVGKPASHMTTELCACARAMDPGQNLTFIHVSFAERAAADDANTRSCARLRRLHVDVRGHALRAQLHVHRVRARRAQVGPTGSLHPNLKYRGTVTRLGYSGTRGASQHNSHIGGAYYYGSGLLDLCIGDFWLTPERLELTPFTTPVTLEHLHLFAPSKNRRAERTMQKATKVYEVFSESLWLTIVVRATMFF
jgi:hypothetical protein